MRIMQCIKAIHICDSWAIVDGFYMLYVWIAKTFV